MATSLTVGIRELRNNLSKFVDRVRAGDEIVITDRGRPVARLVPSDELSAFDRLVAEGLVERAPRYPARRRPVEPQDVGGPVSDLVAEERG